jgi:anti-sigma factor RsiW
MNDRRERFINFVRFINQSSRELRNSDDVTLHNQTAYMTSAILDSDDRCPTLVWIANTVAKNRTVREIYEGEADQRHCPPTENASGQRTSVRSVSAGLIPVAAADDGRPQDIRAIYVYRQKNGSAAATLTHEVTQKLNALGYNVPGENDVDTRIAQNEIRYFNKRDEAAATNVQAQLASATGKQFVVQDYSAKQPGRPGFLEIYVAD